MKYKKKFLEFFKDFPLFTFNDAKLFLLKSGASYAYARKFISLMVKNGSVYRLNKGNYTLYKDINVTGYIFKPFYYGLGTALNYHNLWEQQSNQTIITTNNVRRGVRTFFGLNIVIERIPAALFFGFFKVNYDKFHFYISDIEKTIIDMAYYNFVVEDYVYENIFSRINRQKMKKYLARVPVKTRLAVLKLERQYSKKR